MEGKAMNILFSGKARIKIEPGVIYA